MRWTWKPSTGVPAASSERAISRAARLTAVGPASPSRTAPASLLRTRPGTTAFSATGPPSSAAARPAARAEATSRLATTGMPQQRSRRSTSPGASQPPPPPRPAATIVAAVAVSASAGSNGGSGGAARRRACRDGVGERPHRLLRRREARDGARVGGRGRVGAQPDGEHRPPGAVRRGGDAAGDLGRARRQRPHEDGHDRVDRVVGEQDAQRRARMLASRASAAGRGQVGSRGRAGAQRRAASHASSQATPGPAGVGEHRDAVAARQRLAREQPRDVEHLPHRLGPQHAGVREQRVDGHVRRRQQRAGVRRRARRPAAVRPPLTATIGLVRVIRRAIRPNRRGFPNDSR